MNTMINFRRIIRPAVGISNEGAREHWIKKTLSAIPGGGRILDAGAGTQQYKPYCSHLHYVSQDFGAYDGKGDSSGLQTGGFNYGELNIISDITSIPEPDSSFDAIMCTEVLEHLPDPVLAVKEFSRLLKPGGRLIITAPFCSLTHFAPYHFSTGFNKYWYETHLKIFGFQIIELSKNGNFFEYLAQEIYRIPRMSNTYANIKPNYIEKFCIIIVQHMLLKFSKRGNKSSELLCYGYHVLAEKV